MKGKHMKRTILTALLATAFAAPAYSAAIPHNTDETDLSWQYLPATYKPQFEGSVPAAKAPVQIGDETDASWIYAPQAKPFFDGRTASAAARPFVESNDENDLAWLYQAPSAGSLADPRREQPYTAFGSSSNPLARLRNIIGKSQTTGE
jgi:hypothetical protein